MLWPKVDDAASARKAARLGAYGTWIIAGLTLLLLLEQALVGDIDLPKRFWAGVVVGIVLALLGWGTWKLSRAAAVLTIVTMLVDGALYLFLAFRGSPIIAIALWLTLIHGVRGTFGWHKYAQNSTDTQTDD
jgi:hypothetical protein